MNVRCCILAGERPDRVVREGRETGRAVDCLRDERTVFAVETADQPPDASLPAETTSTVAGASPPTCDRCAR